MWDWDAGQPPKPSGPQFTRRQWTIGLIWLGAGLGLFAVMAGLIMRAGYQQATPQRWTVAESAPGPGPMDDGDAIDLNEFLGGNTLFVGNPDPLGLQPGAELELRNRETEARVTPGAVELRTEGCADTPFVVVPVTMVVEKGSALMVPSYYRLRTAKGVDVSLIEACTSPAASATTLNEGERLTVELAFPGAEPGWLVLDPDRGSPQAMWRIT
jgi:hypothetical protein